MIELKDQLKQFLFTLSGVVMLLFIYSCKDRPLHGMYHRQIEEVADTGKSYQWTKLTERKQRGTKYGSRGTSSWL